jgi:hypothetical protein
MAFHIPFEHRHRGQPIYIGFDVPAVPRRRWNPWGFFGFGLSLFAFLTAGFLSPLALVLNLIGLRREPRGLARAGTVLSLIGCTVAGGVVLLAVNAEKDYRSRQQRQLDQILNVELAQRTSRTLQQAEAEFREFASVNAGQLPTWIDANMVAIKHKDGWGESLRFDVEKDGAKLRSAGPDHQFDTGDDLLLKVDGQCERSSHGEI